MFVKLIKILINWKLSFIAQLGERSICVREVTGSSPVKTSNKFLIMFKKINEIYLNEFDLNKPNTYEIFFKNNVNNLPTISLNDNDTLILTLLKNLNEIEFFKTYSKLNNIGLDNIEYLNFELFNFTFKIDDDRIKFWIIYLYNNPKLINFILWLIQYKIKNKIIINLTIDDIPILNKNEILDNLHYVNKTTNKVSFLFNSKLKGISIL